MGRPTPLPPTDTRDLRVVRPGRVGYSQALAWQREAADALRNGRGPEILFLLQHPPVVTMGRRATEDHVLFSREELAARGVEVVETDRGGDVTFHGPGQVVGYPILDLRKRGLGAHTYLRFLEEKLIAVLATYGIEAFRDPLHTGVWTTAGKIAAMGIRVSAGVSLHGFALNANTDLAYFDLIVPCGIQGRAVASMQHVLGRAVDVEELMDRIAATFAPGDGVERLRTRPARRSPRSSIRVEASSQPFNPVPESEPRRRLPPWFKRPLGGGPEFAKLTSLVGDLGLHTVCQSARCPNQGECWTIGTATFMILGDVCTRGCRYCAVPKGKPLAADLGEPARVGHAVVTMNLRHAVITSVDRDDMEDGGAAIWAATIREIRKAAPGCAVEVLIPDFRKSAAGALEVVMAERPDILNHNIETVPRLFPMARKGGDYEFSIDVLRRAKSLSPATPTKSGMMLGLGERDDEIGRVLGDLRAAGVDIVSMGQYLAPERNAFYLPVARFVHPDEFAAWARYGKDLGFRHVEAGPLVRSSYHAEKQAGGTRAGE